LFEVKPCHCWLLSCRWLWFSWPTGGRKTFLFWLGSQTGLVHNMFNHARHCNTSVFKIARFLRLLHRGTEAGQIFCWTRSIWVSSPFPPSRASSSTSVALWRSSPCLRLHIQRFSPAATWCV
jgi:hypothetical protein